MRPEATDLANSALQTLCLLEDRSVVCSDNFFKEFAAFPGDFTARGEALYFFELYTPSGSYRRFVDHEIRGFLREPLQYDLCVGTRCAERARLILDFLSGDTTLLFQRKQDFIPGVRYCWPTVRALYTLFLYYYSLADQISKDPPVIRHTARMTEAYERFRRDFTAESIFELPEDFAYRGANPMQVRRQIIADLNKEEVEEKTTTVLALAVLASIVGPGKAFEGLGRKKDKYGEGLQRAASSFQRVSERTLEATPSRKGAIRPFLKCHWISMQSARASIVLPKSKSPWRRKSTASRHGRIV